MVTLALQSTSPDACAAGDLNRDHTMEAAELIAGVGSALRGCIDTPLTPSPTATVAPTARPTLSPDSALYREFDRVSRGACERDRVQILYMAGRLPVIATDDEGEVRALVNRAGSGHLVRPGDAAAIAERLLDLKLPQSDGWSLR